MISNTYHFKKDLIFSICIAGLFLAIIIFLNYIFDLFKGFGGYSIQIFLIPFSLVIYKMKNIVVSLFFLIITPVILFFIEQGPYIISALQVFIEYFVVYYVAFIFYFAKLIIVLIEKKYKCLIATKKMLWIETIVFMIFYVILITIKFFIHSASTYYFWINKKSWIVAFSSNFLGVFINGIITIPILISISPAIIYLFNKHNKLQSHKY